MIKVRRIQSTSEWKTLKVLTLLDHVSAGLFVWLNRAASKILIEIGCVNIRIENRNKRSLYWFCQESIPVDFFKPRMIFNFLGIIETNSTSRIFL